MNNSISLLLQLSKGIFFIDPIQAQAFGPAVAALFSGKGEDIKALLPELYYSGPLKNNLPFYSATQGGSPYESLDQAPRGSVSIVPVKGAIMKQDYCGSPGTKSMLSFLKAADQHSNISGHILEIDSPGGAADAWLDLSEGIKSLNKPVIAWVDGMAASAAFGIASAATEIIAANEMSQIGSIGTYISWRDYKSSDEARGIKTIEVYASRSTEKNLEFREAANGNTEPLLKNLLDPINEIFLTSVERNRFNKKLNTEKAFTGKLFLAKEAKSTGLIDSIGSFDYALSRIQKLTKTK